ncbi:MAG: PKD-like family lipoprotein, partial [Rikenellaceae bacterium]
MKNIFYIFSIVVLSCLSSCYADKGNYDYSSINEITILKMPQEMITAVRYGENLKISVEVKGTKGGEDSYKYEWKAVLKNTYDVSKNSYILGTEKNLDCPITLEENVYVLSLNVQDPASGVTWSQSVDLNVTNYTREGWLILSEQNGKSRLDMISRSTEEEIKLGDFLAGYNDPIMKAPKQLILSATMGRPESIILVTEGGTTYLNSDNFYWLPEYNFLNEFGEKEENTKVKAVIDKYSVQSEFCFTEKNVYVRN